MLKLNDFKQKKKEYYYLSVFMHESLLDDLKYFSKKLGVKMGALQRDIIESYCALPKSKQESIELVKNKKGGIVRCMYLTSDIVDSLTQMSKSLGVSRNFLVQCIMSNAVSDFKKEEN